MAGFSVTYRRACRLVGVQRSTFYYRSRAKEQTVLKIRLRDLALARVRYGYRRLTVLLQREGWPINHKRVYRLYTQEGLTLRPRRQKRRRSAVPRKMQPMPEAPDQVWGMDFVHDQLSDGRRFRILTIVDHFSRESLAVEAESGMSGQRVAEVLGRLVQRRGTPGRIQVDNGSEFTSKALDQWAYRNAVQLDFIRPGKPIENAVIESFNGRLRDECLNQHWFASLEEARGALESWRRDYNESRPHSSLGNLAPREFARKQPRPGAFEPRTLALQVV